MEQESGSETRDRETEMQRDGQRESEKNRGTQTHREKLGQRQRDEGKRGRDI